MAMNTSIYGEQYPDGYDWRANPLGLRDPRGGWVGADDPSRALDISGNEQVAGPKAATIGAMLDRYNQPGGWWGSAGQNTGATAPAPKRAAAGDGLAINTRTTGAAQPTGNMFLDARGSGGAPGAARGGAAPANSGGGYLFDAGVAGRSGTEVGARRGYTGNDPNFGNIYDVGGARGSGLDPAGIRTRGGAAATSNAGDLTDYLDPGYQFRLAEGIKALQSGAAGAGNFLSGQTLKDLLNYGQGAASQEYANAYNRMAGDRNYATELEKWNRTFGRDTSQQDWTNDTVTLQMLLNAGMGGAQGSASAQNLLATLLAQAAIAKGQVGAGGSVANSNLLTQLINQLLDLDGG